MIFDMDIETLPREELEALQLKRLQSLCERVYANVAFYRRAFDEAGIKPGDVKSLADLRYLPFTEKQDMRNHYPFGLFAVPKDNVVRIHASSGTTGRATVVGYTQRDVNNWATMMARSFMAAGASRRDIIHVAYGYGLFTGGLGAHYGAERLGATTIPMSGGSTRRQVMLLRDFGATVLCCTPSYSLVLYEAALESGIDFKELPLRVGVFGAEPWTDEMRRDIEQKMGIKAIDIYGLSEIMGPGVGIECIEAQNGAHLQEDHFLCEVIDPVTKEPVGPGEAGELVITTLTKEAQPLIRYRTRDITRLVKTPCKCGRTFARMQRVQGRSDDMLIIRGVNVFPSQIEEALLSVEGTAPHYVIVLTNDGTMDDIEVHVEMTPEIFSDRIAAVEGLAKKISAAIERIINIRVKVRLVEPNTIARSEGKAKRVLDQRKK